MSVESHNWLDRLRGRRVLVTGHTGFKGGWLSVWLQHLGAHVTGVALPPEGDDPSFFELLGLEDRLDSHFCDIRDPEGLAEIVTSTAPDVVVHMAAQALVRRSYSEPAATYATNVLGTAHLFEAVRATPSVRCVVNVTTDKCYENRGWARGYVETDTLGGHDPYSSSKAAAEIVTSAYRRSFFEHPGAPGIATARAGNAIGGGDWSPDRLIPDIVRALTAGDTVVIRNPEATRPWQHTLEPLGGYLKLACTMLESDDAVWRDAWNFGPGGEANVSVREVLTLLDQVWPERALNSAVDATGTEHPHEAHLLSLDIEKAGTLLEWSPVWSLETALERTARWYETWMTDPDRLREITIEQIEEYQATLLGAAIPTGD